MSPFSVLSVPGEKGEWRFSEAGGKLLGGKLMSMEGLLGTLCISSQLSFTKTLHGTYFYFQFVDEETEC